MNLLVRNIRQLVDLLRQLADASTNPATGECARRAAEAIQRGVVLASSVIERAGDDADAGAGVEADTPPAA